MAHASGLQSAFEALHGRVEEVAATARRADGRRPSAGSTARSPTARSSATTPTARCRATSRRRSRCSTPSATASCSRASPTATTRGCTAKVVKDGRGEHELSPEEDEAIRLALAGAAVAHRRHSTDARRLSRARRAPSATRRCCPPRARSRRCRSRRCTPRCSRSTKGRSTARWCRSRTRSRASVEPDARRARVRAPRRHDRRRARAPGALLPDRRQRRWSSPRSARSLSHPAGERPVRPASARAAAATRAVVTAPSTADAVRQVAGGVDGTRAALGTRRAAERYGGDDPAPRTSRTTRTTRPASSGLPAEDRAAQSPRDLSARLKTALVFWGAGSVRPGLARALPGGVRVRAA